MLEKLAKDDYRKKSTIRKEFGLVLKEGPAEDFANKETVAKLVRLLQHNDSSEQTVSLEDYISRMKRGKKLSITLQQIVMLQRKIVRTWNYSIKRH